MVELTKNILFFFKKKKRYFEHKMKINTTVKNRLIKQNNSLKSSYVLCIFLFNVLKVKESKNLIYSSW